MWAKDIEMYKTETQEQGITTSSGNVRGRKHIDASMKDIVGRCTDISLGLHHGDHHGGSGQDKKRR